MKKLYLLTLLVTLRLPLVAQEESDVQAQQSAESVSWGSCVPSRQQRASERNQSPAAKKTEPLNPAYPLTPSPSPVVAKEESSHLQIGGNYTYAHVKPSGQPSTSGSLGGAQASYEFKTRDRIYGGITFAWRQGNTDGSGGERWLLEFDTEERIGYTWGIGAKDILISLFSGLGYRHFREKVTTPGNSLVFNYNHLYVPVGALLRGKIYSFFYMGLNFQWMPQIYPTVAITSLKGAHWILTHEIFNCRVELPFTFYVSKSPRLSLIFQPFFEYWKDGHTVATTGLGTSLDIPENRYLFSGADLNLCYSF